jgi:hypothetical protein
MKHIIIEKASATHKYLKRLGVPKAYRYVYKEPDRRSPYARQFDLKEKRVNRAIGKLAEGKTLKMEPGVTEENRGSLFKVRYKKGDKVRSLTVRAVNAQHAEQLVSHHTQADKILDTKVSPMSSEAYKTFKMKDGREGAGLKAKTREPLRDLKTIKMERDKFTVGSPEWKKLDAERIATRYLQKEGSRKEELRLMRPEQEGKTFKMKTILNTTPEERMQVAKTIADQMGGAGRIKAMTGASNFTALGSGLSFDFPNRRGANHVKITLEPDDTYTVEFYKKPGVKALMSGKVDWDKIDKPLSTHSGIYFDQLKDVFEKETGLYLSL